MLDFTCKIHLLPSGGKESSMPQHTHHVREHSVSEHGAICLAIEAFAVLEEVWSKDVATAMHDSKDHDLPLPLHNVLTN